MGCVELDIDAEYVAARGHALVEHQVHVVRERVEQVDIAFGEFLLGLERYYHPVCGIDGIDYVFGLADVHLARGLFGCIGYGVHGHDFTAHVDGLRERYGTEEDVVYVVGHRFFGYEGHLGGYVLAIGPLDGFAGDGVLDQVELVALRGEVETLDRQQLVAVENRQLALVVEIAAVEVDAGQVGRESFFFLISGLAYALARHHQLLVVGQCHAPEFL